MGTHWVTGKSWLLVLGIAPFNMVVQSAIQYLVSGWVGATKGMPLEKEKKGQTNHF